MAKLQFWLVNAFATHPHGGNQAAVVLIPPGDKHLDDEEFYAATSKDFNLPMTAFVSPTTDSNEQEPKYKMRWFESVGHEAPLCGHATLATSFVLLTHVHPSAKSIQYDTLAGTLAATAVERRGQGMQVCLSLALGGPAKPTASPSESAFYKTVTAAGVASDQIISINEYMDGTSAVIQLKPSVDLEAVKIDHSHLLKTGKNIFTQVIGPGEGGVRINSRVFNPSGIPEDPVTGSAHAVLAEYYLQGAGKHLVSEFLHGDQVLDAHQVSERGGAMKCQIVDGRVLVTGQGWQTGSGELEL